MRINRYTLLIATAMMWLGIAAGNVTIKAKLDSTHLVMGRVTALHLEIVQDNGTQGRLALEKSDTLTSMVEIASKPKADTTQLGNKREQINRDLILQAFDSGLYVLPPIEYIVGADTVQSNPLSLKVLPVPVDTTKNIIDIKPVESVPFKLFDWVPDWIADYWWAWLLALLLIAGGIYYYLKWYRHGRNPLRPEKKRLPPYDEAMINLEALKQRQLWQNGQEKEYFTGLTDILRVYIDRRFGINAVEMTSTEIVKTLKERNETRAVNEQLTMILEMADIVKFAAVRPLADDNEMAYQRAVNFVEQTKPIVEPSAADTTEKEVKP
ncbi:MAG: cell wall anchor protein [Muribaculaceae bacterium]|nr:cell wall anchor protein [Muribaculaceae bacterium]